LLSSLYEECSRGLKIGRSSQGGTVAGIFCVFSLLDVFVLGYVYPKKSNNYNGGFWALQIRGLPNGRHFLIPCSYPFNLDQQLPQDTWGTQNLSWSLTSIPKHALCAVKNFSLGTMLCSGRHPSFKVKNTKEALKSRDCS
jgi:hypothetical protein